MSRFDVGQVILYLGVLVFCVPWVGTYMAKVFEGQSTFMAPVLAWLERLIYRLIGVNEQEEMNWRDYTKSLLWFNFFGFLLVFLIQLFQRNLPLNPEKLPDVSWHTALNTAVSFMTNTNWQSYAGESTMSYLTQMLGLTVQNFLSAATGVAVFLALTRGITRKSETTLGNFWADITRTTVYVLLPLSALLAIVLVGQGVVQTLAPYPHVITLEGVSQTIPLGPAASQIAIKQIGTNGCGFFNANSAHPFENLGNFTASRRAHLHVWKNGKIHPPGLDPFHCDVRNFFGDIGGLSCK